MSRDTVGARRLKQPDRTQVTPQCLAGLLVPLRSSRSGLRRSPARRHNLKADALRRGREPRLPRQDGTSASATHLDGRHGSSWTSSADEADALIEGGLVPDLILPDHRSGMTSTDLARMLKEPKPTTPVLLNSGHQAERRTFRRFLIFDTRSRPGNLPCTRSILHSSSWRVRSSASLSRAVAIVFAPAVSGPSPRSSDHARPSRGTTDRSVRGSQFLLRAGSR
jgi:hypothetical protein